MPSTQDYLAAQPNFLKSAQQGSDYANGIYDQAAKLQSGQQFATGDYQGAATTLAQRGDIPDAESVKNYGTSQFQLQHEYIQRAIPVFQHIYQTASGPNGNAQAGTAAVTSAFDTIAPDLKTLGVPDQTIAQYRTSLASDPQGTLQALNAVGQRKFSYQKVGDDGVGVFDDNTGQMIGYHQGNKFMTVGPGQKAIQVGDNGSTPVGAPGGAPATAPQSVAAPAATSPSAAAPTPANGAPPPANDALFGSQPVKPTAVSMVESSNDPNAVSPKGATGTMQTMPGTLASPGFGVTPAKDNSPEEQARVGTDYLSALQQHYGNPTIALVAYNMGPGNTDAWLKAGGNFKDLPAETQSYLGHVAVAQATGQGSASILGAPNGGAAPVPASGSTTAAPTASGGARVVFDGGPATHPATADDKANYPGAVAIDKEGKPIYPPTSALGASMTDAQVQPYVDILRAGGTIPQSLARNPALYTRVLNVAAQQGVAPEDFLSNQANRKATAQTFAQVNTRYAMVQTQEQAFQNSLNLAYSLAQKAGPQGGGTLINGFRNYLKTGVVGDPATGAFVNAVNTAMNEYGKIIEGSTGNGGSSISARADANQMLSAADNLPAFVAKMKVLEQDAGFKIGALKDQHDSLLTALGGIGQAQPDATPAPSAAPSTGWSNFKVH